MSNIMIKENEKDFYMKNIEELSEPLYAPAFGSYVKEDVEWLLKDLSNYSIEAPTEDREESIQNGDAHYSESLPIEYQPSKEYKELFIESLQESEEKIAEAVGLLSEQVMEARNKKPVLVSLARAGVPIGILIKRYIKTSYNIDVPHYAISIVRGKGIDFNALDYITSKYPSENIMFIDGWTGKGAITKELTEAVKDYNNSRNSFISDDLAVLADPASCVKYYGTREDFLIPSACLNSTVSGLISRTILNEELIGVNDYHGAKFYKEFLNEDYSNIYINSISKYFNEDFKNNCQLNYADHVMIAPTWEGWRELETINESFGINNMNLIKPGVGETTRVLLRRVPWRILINPKMKDNLKHILLLAEQRNVPVEEYTDLSYSCVGLIHPQYTKGATGSDGRKA